MSPDTAIAPDRSAALIREIEAQCESERTAILDAARREADAIVESAFSTARGRAQEALASLGQEAGRRLARADAQIETERRLRDQARAAEILHTGCPMLINVIVDRWHVPQQRRGWIATVARHAARRLIPAAWIVEHPRDWTASDASALRDALAGLAGVTLTFRQTSDFEAGLRILSGDAVLDGTPERLLADKAKTQARLLAEMNRAAARVETRGDAP